MASVTPSMQASRSTPPRRSPRSVTAWLAASLAGLFIVSACSGGGSSSAESAGAGAAAEPTARNAAAPGGGGAAAMAPPDSPSTAGSVSAQPLLRESLIKTAAVTLESKDIASVIATIDELAVRAGGSVASEDTSSNTEGVQVRSRIVLKVPVRAFDGAVDEIAKLGDLVSKSRSSQDVTSRVVDVNSRVLSAKDSIVQLRTLFRRATKLTDVIALERELSDREANLEVLQSEQRSLAARTTMSTITVNVTSTRTASPASQEHAGFLSGIVQGWDGMTTFVVAFSHGVGLVLPLGSLALVAAVLTWLVVRRFMPRHVRHPSE